MLRFEGVFYSKNSPMVPLLVFDDLAALRRGNPFEPYYPVEQLAAVSANYAKQENDLQVEEFDKALTFLKELAKLHDYNH